MMRDDFLRRLAWDLRQKCTGKFLDRMRRFYVDDIFGDETEVIFVCESPHTDEVRKKFPLAGSAGSTVTNKVYGKILGKSSPNVPIGKLLHDGCGDLRWLGIMNVCPIPMQAPPYGGICDSNLTDSLEIIRKTTPKKMPKARKSATTFRVEETILYSFRYRVEESRKRFPHAMMIPCGRFAEYFFIKSYTESFMPDIPHPAPREGALYPWNIEKIEEMCGKIRKYIGL